jgi:hypothetical protein
MDECYTLDNDLDFSNCSNNNNQYMQQLLDNKRHIKFTLNALRYTDALYFTTFHNYRKGYIRIELPNNNEETIKKTIKFFTDLIIQCGNYKQAKIFTINILLNLYLCTHFEQKIETIDVEQFLSQHTDEEINGLIYRRENNRQVYNSKYMFTNKKAFYLDIPLCDDFYCDNKDFISKKIISLEYPSMYVDLKRVEKDYPFTIEFEENILLDNPHKPSNCHIFSTAICKQYIAMMNNIVYIPIILSRCKYVFIVMKKTDYSTINLLNIKLDVKYNSNVKQYDIELSNMIMMDCFDKTIYAFSLKDGSDMNCFNDDNDKCTEKSYQYHNGMILLSHLTLTFNMVVEPTWFQIVYVQALGLRY